jgi:predicted membrane protein
MTSEPRRPTWALATSLIVIAAGVVLLLNQVGVLRPGLIHHFWPVLLVVVGLARMVTTDQTVDRLWAGGLILLGVVLEVNRLGIAHIGLEVFWPLLIIGAGVILLWHTLAGKTAVGTEVSTLEHFDLNYIFGGGEPRVETRNFCGGRLTAIFGGFKLDLSRAEIAADQATIEANAIFGGGEICVPESWEVVVQGSGIFGGYENNARHFQSDPSRPSKTLVIKGAAVFGGIVVRN